MIQRIIDLSVRHRATVLVLTAIACAFGYWSMVTMPVDAIPDLGETQVIVYTHWDRSPEVVESQVTYPIVTSLLGAPHVKTVRGISDFGNSYVYVIFDESTDLYWARSRTVEYLSSVRETLPEGVVPQIGPDATSLGWVYQYALVDESGQHSIADLRSYQDWYLRYYLKSVPGVADVAPVGGFERQYQVNLDLNRLQAYGISTEQVIRAVRGGNIETSGRVLEFGGTEYIIRGRGYARTLQDFENIPVATGQDGTPIRIRDLGSVSFGPDIRRGVAELNGKFEVVSGVVIMRSDENALQVIDRVKAKMRDIAPSMPPGVKIVPIYDRSQLIRETVHDVRMTILAVVVTVVLIIVIFLWHFPSAIIPIVTMPAAVLLAFIPLKMMGVTANVMSLAGIAIAFGELIDASIIIVEQTHKRLEQWEKSGRLERQSAVVLAAVKEVARPTFFALLVIGLSFVPVFMLGDQEGRMFRPLAYAKSLSMVAAALLVLTLDPALRFLLCKVKPMQAGPRILSSWFNRAFLGPIQPEEKHRISGPLMRAYEPVVRWTLDHKPVVFIGACLLMIATIPAFLGLGSEFIPPMNEGSILYMPSTAPGISVTEAKRLLQVTDGILKQFPEVDQVLGKAGRAETPTDPAPLSMLETVITLKPQSQWRRVDTWYSSWAPEWLRGTLRHVTRDTISPEELQSQMDAALRVPGMRNAWTMPIRGRIDMLTSGMRTPVGIKISGNNFGVLSGASEQVESVLKSVRGTRGVFAERNDEGHFIDVTWNRTELARYGLSVEQAQAAVSNAIGGDNVTTVVDGPERYGVNVRYMRDYRSGVDDLNRVLVSASGQHPVPIGKVATVQFDNGPAMIRDENGLLTTYVYIDLAGRDPGSYITEARKTLAQSIHLPPGVLLTWSGQFESMQRVNHRLLLAVPLTISLILLLIGISTRSFVKTLIVLLAVPFSAIGAVWLLYLLHYNMSVAVWVGLIGLLSIDAETGVFMLLYLDIAYREATDRAALSAGTLRQAVINGAAKRLRPKLMTFATTCIGLLPVMWSAGPGADVLKRIAAPMIGGIATSFLLELLVYPAIFEVWKSRSIEGRTGSTVHRESEDAEPVLVGSGSSH